MNHSPHFQKLLRLLAPLLVAAALAPAPARADQFVASIIAQLLKTNIHVGKDEKEPDRVQLRPIAEPYSHLGLSLLPAVETPSPSEGVKGLRFNLLVGRHRELRGLDIGVIGNEVTGTAGALQIAGIYNWVGDPTDFCLQFEGIQFAGILNHCDGDSYAPLQVAGVLNHCAGDFAGIQAAGVCNVVVGRIALFQFAGILNYCAECDETSGVGQFAGVMNCCADDFAGPLQAAGVMNYCADDFYGWQAAGVCNVAGGTMSGFQLGLVNYAGHLKGLQIGAVNLAGTGGGVQIGLWNSAKSLEGLQIGLCNVNTDSSMPFFPVVNFSF